MACAAPDMSIRSLEAEDRGPRGPAAVRYEAAHVVPDARRPLHGLQRQPTAAMGGVQVSSGLLSVGIGLLLGVTHEIGASLITLFRVAHLTGLMFVFAGFVSNQLLRHPGLLHVSVVLNLTCAAMAPAAAALIVADLVLGHLGGQYFTMEVVELGVLALEALISLAQGVSFYQEKNSKASGPRSRS